MLIFLEMPTENRKFQVKIVFITVSQTVTALLSVYWLSVAGSGNPSCQFWLLPFMN